MASPVSISDTIYIARFAIKLGRAFTNGRQSAPYEFREVENQLYSLGATLSALNEARDSVCSALRIDLGRLPSLSPDQTKAANSSDAFNQMLKNCEETLRHLEKFVEDYSSLRRPRDPDVPATRRWKRELKDGWKRLEWTTERDNLATLRSRLTEHTNNLNLLLTVVSHTKTDQLFAMLNEVHKLIAERVAKNFQPESAVPSVPRTLPEDIQEARVPQPSLCFALYAQSSNGQELICPVACLLQDWIIRRNTIDRNVTSTGKPAFDCRCANLSSALGPHHSSISALQLSPFSFPIRLCGKNRSWMLYKASDRSNNKLVSLVITGIQATKIAEFEQSFIELLGAKTARSLLSRHEGTMLAYFAPAETGGSLEVRMVDMMVDFQGIHHLIETVTFSGNGRSYARGSIDDIQLLHYKLVKRDDLLVNTVLQPVRAGPPDTNAELVILFQQGAPASPADDTEQMIVKLSHETEVTREDCVVILKNVDCTGQGTEGEEEEVQPVLTGVDVTFNLTTEKAANRLRNRFIDMMRELKVMSLKSPLPDERIILQLQAGDIYTEAVRIPESDVYVVQSETTGLRRLIVSSRDGCTVLSQELAEDFLSEGGKPNYRSPTFVAQVVGTGGFEVGCYERGFEILEFSDVQIKRRFELGLAAISDGRSPLPELLSN